MFKSFVDTYLLIMTPASEKRRLRLLKEAENHLMDCERELENAQAAVGAMRKRVARLRKQAPTEKVESVAKGDITQYLTPTVGLEPAPVRPMSSLRRAVGNGGRHG